MVINKVVIQLLEQKINKRAQFFLLAAVIISVVVLSLGIISNSAIVNNEPDNFYDFSYEIEKEIGAVIDYQIYTNISPENNLSQFVDLLATEINEKNPDANFVFIYGNNKSMNLRNYGSADVSINDKVVLGITSESDGEACIDNFCSDISTNDLKYNNITLIEEDMQDSEYITIRINVQESNFPISSYRQVIFIIQKDVNDENFVTIG